MPQSVVTLAHPADFAQWRTATRMLVSHNVQPDAVTWRIASDEADGPPDSAPHTADAQNTRTFKISRDTLRLAADVIQSMLPDRFNLAYALIHAHATDTTLSADALARMEEAAETVRAETRLLRQNLFSTMRHEGDSPQWHGTLDTQTHVPESNARFITYQLSLAPWRLALPGRELRWTGKSLMAGPVDNTVPITFASLPPPALPLVTDLDIGRITSLRAVALAAKTCLICPMARHATQTVFGEGRTDARMMFVGEQPGDREDIAGRPFVGPAGQLFDRALHEAAIARDDAYVTNTVKHFKFRPRGTRRIHEKAGREEMMACAPWLAAERRIIRPHVLVMLGATAASALLGRAVTIGRERSRPISLEDGTTGIVTVHPSYLLRIPDEASRAREYARFVDDLRLAATHLQPAAP